MSLLCSFVHFTTKKYAQNMQMTVYVSNSCKRVNVPFYFSLIIPSNLCIFNLTSSDFYLRLRPFWHVSIIFLNLWEPWESSGRGGHFELSISRWPLLPMVSFKLFECLLRLLLFWSWYVKMHVDLKCLAANVLFGVSCVMAVSLSALGREGSSRLEFGSGLTSLAWT